jgi:predicted transcriptional regulator/N-acetylglutamate synthase-like GNAT family acetyltransferase
MSQTKLFTEISSGNGNGAYYIIKLTNEVTYSQETLKEFKKLIGESEDLYPGIEGWFDEKVMPGIKSGTRYAYLVMHEGKPIAEAIVKRGEKTKICSLRIKPAYQNKSIGPFLFAEIASQIEKTTTHVHFTAPESLVAEREGMFERLGFVNICKAKKIYRPGEDEFVFRGEKNNFTRRAVRLHLLSKENQTLISIDNKGEEKKSLVMSIRPKYAKRIISKKKKVEIRRKFSEKLVGSTVFIYASSPMQAIVGESIISSIIHGKPRDIWEGYSEQIGCSKNEFNEYCRGEKTVYAIVLDDLLPYPDPLPWSIFSAAFDAPIHPPQSYRFLKPAGLSPVKSFKIIEPREYQKREAEQIVFF